MDEMTAPEVASSASSSRVLAVNAAANMVRAASGSLENILLPLILLLLLPSAQYGAWAVVFSISTYVTYLDLGLQGAVQANVARCVGSGDWVGAAKMAWAGTKVASGVGALAFVAMAAAADGLGHVFPDIPPGLLGQAAAALIILSIGQLANLCINVLASYYAGHQRSVFPSLVMSVARAASLLCVLGIALLDRRLPLLGYAYSGPLVAGFLVLFVAFVRELRRLARHSKPQTPIVVTGTRASYLLRYSGPLMLWNVCALVISAAGVAIVGRIEFGAVALYSVSTMLVLAIGGVDTAIMSPVLSELGRQASSGDRVGLGRTVMKASRINSVILAVLICLACVIAAILAATGRLIGHNGDATAVPVLLIVAASVRLAMTPLIFGFVATGDHRRVIIQPILEAIVYLGLAIGLGGMFGVIGVVSGTAVAAAVGVILVVSWSRKAACFVQIVPARDFVRAVGMPLACAFPAIALTLMAPWSAVLGPVVSVSSVLLAAASSVALIWFLCVPAEVKTALVEAAHHLRAMVRA